MKKVFPRLLLVGTTVILFLTYFVLQCIPSDVIFRVEQYRAPLFILAVIAGFVFAFFIFVTILKKRISFIPNLCIIFGVFGYLLSAFLFHEGTLFPTVAHTSEEAFLGIVCIAAATALYKKRERSHSGCR